MESLSPTVVLVEWCSSVHVETEWAGGDGDGVGLGNGGSPGRVTAPVLSRREPISSLEKGKIHHLDYVMDTVGRYIYKYQKYTNVSIRQVTQKI